MASRYRQDMRRARSRIAGIPTGKLETRLGTVEYAERGTGSPVLVRHGVFGCHADPVDGPWTRMLGEGFRVVAPSRFGYFGSTLPPQAAPADQAEVLANARLGGPTPSRLLKPIQSTVTTVARIPGATLVTIDRGGHLFLSHDVQVRAAIDGFLGSVAQSERRPT